MADVCTTGLRPLGDVAPMPRGRARPFDRTLASPLLSRDRVEDRRSASTQAGAAPTLIDSARSARSAGLRFVHGHAPGIRRLRVGANGHARFRYVGPDGRPVRDLDTLARIDALRIPPAWTDVWITTDPRGHLQATGRDARGRKQYRYHPRFREVRDATKFDRMLAFGRALPAIRARVEHDLASPKLTRERVVATAVRLLDRTLIRVGHEEYVRENHSYGLTTLRRRHARVVGDAIELHFRGKGGKERRISVRDPRAARVVRRCEELPGQELFKYVDASGALHPISSEDVNAYLREAAGGDFTAKDFRTWAGTVLAGQALRELCARAVGPRSADRQLTSAIAAVAEVLGNTPAVCRKSYVHPWVIEHHRAGTLVRAFERPPRRVVGLRPEEDAVLALLARGPVHARGPALRRGVDRSQRARSAARRARPGDRRLTV
jgi:DNA topoisomerase-1